MCVKRSLRALSRGKFARRASGASCERGVFRFFGLFSFLRAHPRQMNKNTPPTRQLYVTFRGSYPRDEADVAPFFKNYSRKNYQIKLLKNHDAAFVNFKNLQDAKDAFQYVHEMRIGGTACDVKYNKPSRALCIAPLPSSITNEQAIALSTPMFAKFGDLDSVKVLEQAKRGRTLLVTFVDENAAMKATRELQEHTEHDWKWDIEFYRVENNQCQEE